MFDTDDEFWSDGSAIKTGDHLLYFIKPVVGMLL
jgi:hypothetical protein